MEILGPSSRVVSFDTVSALESTIRRHLWFGATVGLALVAGLGGWMWFTEIAGAVIARGQLVAESEVKKVQHPTGGVVSELRVHEGDHVRAGDVLIRLDETQTRANLEIVLRWIDELMARCAREEAELDDASLVEFPTDLLSRGTSDLTVARLIASERNLFSSRVAAREGQKAQFRQRIEQLRDEIKGLAEQAEAKQREDALIADELKGVDVLWQQNLVPKTRLTSLERDAARLHGELGQITSSIAETKGKITEIELQITQVDRDMRGDVGKDLAEIRGKLSEAQEKRVAAEDQLLHTDLRAPQDGVVHKLTVHTVGGLVVPSEPAMLIVPEADALVVETRVQAGDIDSVRLGQSAILRFPSFNPRTTPEIKGEVIRLAPDAVEDQKSGTSYYTIRIAISPDQFDRLGSLRLLSGMPVEAFLETGERTVLSYLTKPVADQISKAWRER
jgi:HlyD family secretion protein